MRSRSEDGCGGERVEERIEWDLIEGWRGGGIGAGTKDESGSREGEKEESGQREKREEREKRWRQRAAGLESRV